MAIKELVELSMRVADLERRAASSIVHGSVAEIDMATKRMRLDLGEATTGGRFLSPWIPYAQHAGALAVHTPPTVGMQLSMIVPGGDLQQAVALPLTWSDDFQSPSDVLEENVITYGNVRIELRDGQMVFYVGDGATVDITTDVITVSHGDASEVTVTADQIDARQGGSEIQMTADQIEARQGGSEIHMTDGQIDARQGGSEVQMTDGQIEAKNGGSDVTISDGAVVAHNGASTATVDGGKIELNAPVVIIS